MKKVTLTAVKQRTRNVRGSASLNRSRTSLGRVMRPLGLKTNVWWFSAACSTQFSTNRSLINTCCYFPNILNRNSSTLTWLTSYYSSLVGLFFVGTFLEVVGGFFEMQQCRWSIFLSQLSYVLFEAALREICPEIFEEDDAWTLIGWRVHARF